jgi:hypothetical protein
MQFLKLSTHKGCGQQCVQFSVCRVHYYPSCIPHVFSPACQAEKKRKKEAEWMALSGEERAVREEEEASMAKHETKKGAMLTSQLKLYGSSSARGAAVRGRGRGRGK